MVRTEGFEPSSLRFLSVFLPLRLESSLLPTYPDNWSENPDSNRDIYAPKVGCYPLTSFSETYRQNCLSHIPLEPNYNGCFKVANSMSDKRSAYS